MRAWRRGVVSVVSALGAFGALGGGAAGAGPGPGPSCTGAPGAGADCGAESCCARLHVPGGAFELTRDDGARERAEVAGHWLGKLEVTVGRLRAWVRAGEPTPSPGTVIFGSGPESVRWQSSWRVIPEGRIAGWARYDTWNGGDERRPANQIDWYTAAAFCHWDGGRLPTEVEWKYAAVGGDEQRPYPWGTDTPSPELATYDCLGDGHPDCSLADILPVGSHPRGAGRWGHLDLAGSMFEWTIDGAHARDAQPVAHEERSRGAGFCYIGGVDRRARTHLRPMVVRVESATTTSHMVGVRCAYDAP